MIEKCNIYKVKTYEGGNRSRFSHPTFFKVKSLNFCSLLDKKVKREVEIDADYYCFEIDDKFLVGYGLDYDGYYRNLPYIGYV